VGLKIGELFVDLLVDTSNGQLEVGELVSRIGQLEIASLGAAGILATLGIGIANLVDSTIQYSGSIEDLHIQTGLSTEAIQRWVMAGQQFRVSAQTTMGGLESLSHGLEKLHQGNPQILEAARWLGINPAVKDVTELLDQLFDAQKRLTPLQFSTNAEALGLPSQMVNDFAAGRAAFYKAYNEAQPESDAMIQTAIAAQKEWAKVGLEFQHIGQIFSKDLLEPARKFGEITLGILKALKGDWTSELMKEIHSKENLGTRFGGSGLPVPDWAQWTPRNIGARLLETLDASETLWPTPMLSPAMSGGARVIEIRAPIIINGNDPHTIGKAVRDYVGHMVDEASRMKGNNP